MPIPCRHCGALLDSYSDYCGCPESARVKELQIAPPTYVCQCCGETFNALQVSSHHDKAFCPACSMAIAANS